MTTQTTSRSFTYSVALNTFKLAVLFIFLNGNVTRAQLLQWNTFGNLGTETTEPSVFNDANIAGPVNITMGSITAALNGNRFGGSGWFDTGNTVAGNTLAEAVTGNDYVQFIVTPNGGFSFTPTSFVFTWDRSGTGPSSVTLRSSADGFVTDLGTVAGMVSGGAATTTIRTITIASLTNISASTTFRLYGYGATATAGTGGFDNATSVVNVQLNGTTSPTCTSPVLAINSTTNTCTGFSNGAINVDVTGGTPSFNYLWSNAATTEDISNVGAGTYTVTVTSTGGCSSTISGTVSAIALPTVNFTGLPSNLCLNASSVTLTGNQAPSGTFTGTGITDNANGTATFNPATAGVGGPYNITYSYTDISTGCSNTQIQTITVNDAPNIASIGPVSNSCPVVTFDLSSIVLSNSGAAGASTYYGTLTDANNNLNAISSVVSVSGTYFIRVTTAQGCFDVESIVVTIIGCGCGNPPGANAGGNFAICASSNTQLNGSISGGATSASWSGGGGTFNPDANTVNAIYTPTTGEISAGSVTLTLTTDDPDGNGPCIAAVSSVTITINALPNVTVNPVTSSICIGSNTGNIIASGAVAFSWSPSDGSLNSTIGATVIASPVTSTTYTVTGTDANGCQNTATVAVTVNALPVVTVTPNTTTICIGSASGTINASGASTYNWANAGGLSSTTGSSVTANPLTGTTYSVTGTDGNGCSATATLLVTVNPLPVVSVTGSNVICNGSTNLLDAGSGFVSYLWSTGASTQTVSLVSAGTYTVTVTDSNGCTNSATKSFSVSNPPVLSASSTPSSCNISAPGTINLTASGGLPCNANSKGLIISKISSNPSGSDSPFEFVELIATKNIDFSVTPYTVFFTNNGTANSNGWVTGGAISYAFQIGSGTAVAGGVYYVGGDSMPPLTNRLRTINTTTTGGDGGKGNASASGVLGNGGANADAVAVFNLPVGSITSSTVPVDAVFFGNTAIGGAVVSGGTLGYQLPVNDHYSGGKLQSTSFFIPGDILAASDRIIVASGTYDAQNNLFAVSRTYANSSLLSFTAGSSGISLVNSQPYVYAWSNGATTEDLGGLTAGTYTVTVTDCNGCTSTLSQTVVNTPNPAPIILGNLSFCLGNSSNLATSIVFASYIWSNGGTTRVISVNTAGTFTVTVTNTNGCTGSASVTTTPVFCCNITLSGISNPILCNGGNTGIDVTSSNASGSPVYLWDNGATTEDRSGLPAGTYTVTVTYGPSCTQSQSFTITQPQPVIASGSGTNVSCRGTGTGSIIMTPSGGTSPYTYLWNNGSTSQNRNSLVIGTYTVTVQDANLCAATASFTITQPATALIINTNKVNIRCAGGLTGTITAAAAGGVAPYSYSWNTIPAQTTATISGLAAGVYTCTVTDAAGCVKTVTITITQPTPIIVVPSQTNATLPGANDGTASVAVSGGTPGYTYSWNTVPVKTTASVTGLLAGVYKCTVSDSKSCQVKLTFTITEPTGKGSGAFYMDDKWNVSISPNPSEGLVSMHFTSEKSETFSTELTDLTGRLVYTKSNTSVAGDNQLLYDFSNLTRGIYFVKILKGNQLKTLRLELQ